MIIKPAYAGDTSIVSVIRICRIVNEVEIAQQLLARSPIRNASYIRTDGRTNQLQ